MHHGMNRGSTLHRAQGLSPSLYRLRTCCCSHLFLMLVTLIGCAPSTEGSESRATPTKISAITERSPADPVAAKQMTNTATGPAANRPAVACPSQDFETFLKAYANDWSIRKAFTLDPLKAKAPYYWTHNTEPGDPRHPKWFTGAATDPWRLGTLNYWYDRNASNFVYFSGAPKNEDDLRKHVISKSYPESFKTSASVRPIENGYEVEFILEASGNSDGNTHTFTRLGDCWYLEEAWNRSEQALLDCKWPDGCRKMREHEAPSEPY